MTDQPLFESGRMIGPNYRVVRCIGRGGMGEVYEVEHVGLGVRYALKTFAYDGEDFGEMLKTKFLEEGQMLARLKHPHLIRVFDLAYDETAKVLYYVMDLVLYKDGNPYTLEDVDRSDLDEDFVFTWFRDVCDALDYIHAMGVVHRDIKEANLLLTADKHVMLSDFGISHIFGKKLVKTGDAQKTLPHSAKGEHTVLGTEHYMAPEVEAGEDPTPAADAYSLGVTIFRLLTGVWYEPNTDVLALLKNRKYKWATVLTRMLAQNPAQRPQKLADMAVLLKPAKVSPAPKKQSVLPWIIGGVVLLALVAGVVTFAHRRVQTATESVEQAEEERAQLEAEREYERKQREALEAQLVAERAERERQREEEVRREAEQKKAAEAKQRAEAERKRQAEEARRKRAEAQHKAEAERLRFEAEKAKREAEEAARPKIEEAPAVAYAWYTDDSRHAPREVKVEWANGSECRFLPLMSGDTPFWISRYPITIGEWREFKPDGFADMNDVEAAIPLEYGLCPKLNAEQAKECAAFLSAKYRKSLPPGCVIRLAAQDELEMAVARQSTQARCERTGRDMEECVGLGGAVRRAKFAKLQNTAGLNCLGKWSYFGVSEDGLLIAGLAMPHASGVCDLGDSFYPHIVIAPPAKTGFEVSEELRREWVTPDRVIDEAADDVTESCRKYRKPGVTAADVPTNTNYRVIRE